MEPFKASKLTVITPVYNNELTLEELASRVFSVAKPLFQEVEYIFVNDASPDNSKEILYKMAHENKNIKVINFTRNFGQHTALTTGMKYSTGDYILFIDGDLEEDPKHLPLFMNKMSEGYEIVMATRKNSTKGFLRTLGTKLYFFLFNLLSDHKVIPHACAMRLMTRKYVNYLLRFKERPWISGFQSWVGLPIGLISISVDKSKCNKTNYNLFKLTAHARLGLIGFSTKILRLAFITGILISALSFIYGLYIIKDYFTRSIFPGFTSIVTLISFFMGIQFIFLGIIGEYIAEIFLATKNRPENFIYDCYNFDRNYLLEKSGELYETIKG